MRKEISKKEVEKMIEEFFGKENFSSEEVRKIKRLAMKFNIKLGKEIRKFCKKCLRKLNGKIRIKGNWKKVTCKNCGYSNKFRIRARTY